MKYTETVCIAISNLESPINFSLSVPPGALFASLLLGWNCLHRFGIFSAIGLSHAVLWVVRDIEALGGAWWLRKDGAMCDIDDDGEICDLPDEDEVVNGSKVAGVDENVVASSSN